MFRRRSKCGASFSVFALSFERAPERQICPANVAGGGLRLARIFQYPHRPRGVRLRIVHSPELKLNLRPAYENRRQSMSTADLDGSFRIAIASFEKLNAAGRSPAAFAF